MESDSGNEMDETLEGNEEESVDSEKEEFLEIVIDRSSNEDSYPGDEMGIPHQERIPVEEPVQAQDAPPPYISPSVKDQAQYYDGNSDDWMEVTIMVPLRGV